MNQSKHCWQNYVDYHKCILAKGEDFAPCRQFWLAYRSLCPSGWYNRWDEQRGATVYTASANKAQALERPTDIIYRGWELPGALGVRTNYQHEGASRGWTSGVIRAARLWRPGCLDEEDRVLMHTLFFPSNTAALDAQGVGSNEWPTFGFEHDLLIRGDKIVTSSQATSNTRDLRIFG